MASQVSGWTPAPTGGSDGMGFTVENFTAVGRDGRELPHDPATDPLCPQQPVANADCPSIGSGAGVDRGPCA